MCSPLYTVPIPPRPRILSSRELSIEVPSRAMSSSSTRIAESWRQKRSPSGNRVKHRGQTFKLFSEARLNEQRQEPVVEHLLRFRRLDVEQGELQADIELLVGRELDPAGVH